MFLSLIKVDVGGDPNLTRPGREWIKNPYRVHQRLSMAFGQFAQNEEGCRIQRDSAAPNFLYRMEGGQALASNGQLLPARIMVLSTDKPDWEKAFSHARYFLHEEKIPDDAKPFDPAIANGDRLRFRLRANPTKREKNVRENKTHGLRVRLIEEAAQLDWLKRKEVPCGFSLIDCAVTEKGWFSAWKGKDEIPKDQRKLTFYSVLFEGSLTVTDPVAFKQTLAAGIGSGKAFGFGLLSVARG